MPNELLDKTFQNLNQIAFKTGEKCFKRSFVIFFIALVAGQFIYKEPNNNIIFSLIMNMLFSLTFSAFSGFTLYGMLKLIFTIDNLSLKNNFYNNNFRYAYAFKSTTNFAGVSFVWINQINHKNLKRKYAARPTQNNLRYKGKGILVKGYISDYFFPFEN